MKQHLAGFKGNIGECKKVPADVKFLFVGQLNDYIEKGKEKKRTRDVSNQAVEVESVSAEDDDSSESSRARKKVNEISSFFKIGVRDSKQPTIKAYMQTAVGRIAGMSYGYKVPSYHALRVNLLHDAKKNVQLLIDSLRQNWSEFGCTIMGDGWKDTRQRSLINFLVYCPKGMAFIKSVDASGFVTNAQTLCDLFAEIVELVGRDNMVHIVTDNASNYKSVRMKLMERYPTIKWSQCACHCINLIIKDIAQRPDVQSVATLA